MSLSRRNRCASVQSAVPVAFRENFPPSVPETKMTQSHRLHPFLRSSNSPERDSGSLTAFAARTMAPVQVQGHGAHSSSACPLLPANPLSSRKLLILLWRREWDSNPR